LQAKIARAAEHGGWILAEGDTEADMEWKTWMCLVCGWIYDEKSGYPEDGIKPGTRWDELPVNWTCPDCGARKDDFEMVVI
jgi:rubredoxin